MSLAYTSIFVIGNQATRATLTNAYTGNVSSAYLVRNAPQLFLQVEYTMGAAETNNSIQVRVESARPIAGVPVTTDWYRLTTESVSAGVVTQVVREDSFTAVSAAATYDRIEIPLQGGFEYIRVAVKETGVAANAGNCSIKLTYLEDEAI